MLTAAEPWGVGGGGCIVYTIERIQCMREGGGGGGGTVCVSECM